MADAANNKPWGQRIRDAAMPAAALLALVLGAQALGIFSHHLVPSLPTAVPSAFQGTFTATPRTVGQTAAAFGVLLVGAWLGGRVASAFGMPRLSGNLLFGVLVGPSLAAIAKIPPLIGREELASLKLIEGLAITLIALAAGSEIKLSFVRERARTIARLFAGEFLAVAPAVFAALAALLFLIPMAGPLGEAGTGTRLYIAAIVGLLAVADAPAVTIALLKETRATGLFPQLALCNTVLKDVAMVVLFSALLAVGIATLGTGGDAASVGGASPLRVAVTIGLHLVGSLLLGALVAVLLWMLARFLRMRIEMFLVLACFGIAIVSEELHADSLLVALSAGMILANLASERTNERLIGAIDGLLLPVYCVFFGVAGAKLQLDALAVVWPAMLVVVAVRVATKRLGVTRAARRAGVPEPVASWLWTSTLPQAGVTLAMAIQFERAMGQHPWAASVSALLLSVVACNELIGPPLMRTGLVRAGAARGAD